MSRRNNGGGRRLPSPKKRKPIRRHPNPFVQSDIEDAERTHGGASVWDNKEIAQCFAFRNATWQLLPMQPNTTEQTAWTDTKENVLATELRGQGLTRAESKRQAAEAYH